MAQSVNDTREELEHLRSSLLEVRRDLRRMESCIEGFRKEYEPLLQAMAVSSTYWGGLRKELLIHALKGSVWALIGAVVVIVGLGLQKWARGWLA